MFDLKKLKSKERNPRKVRDEKIEQLKKSITEFPKMLALRPIVYDPSTMEVIGGNQRLTALIQLGHKSVPDEWVKSADDLNEDEKKRFLIQDNVQVGDWDTEILNEGFDSDVLAEWGVDVPSFEDGEAAEKDNENERKDLSENIESRFVVEVTCISEREQERLYNEIVNQGYQCRLLTL